MIILDATTKSLEVVLAGAITTNQLPVVASFVEVTTTTYTPASSDTDTNSTTAVTAVAAPAASTQRQVKLLTVRNKDTVAATVIVRLNNNATFRELCRFALDADDLLVYTDGEGFRVLDSAGAVKSTGGGGGGSMDIGAAIGLSTANCVLFVDGSGNLGQNTKFKYTPSTTFGLNVTGVDTKYSVFFQSEGTGERSLGGPKSDLGTPTNGEWSARCDAADGHVAAYLCYKDAALDVAVFGYRNGTGHAGVFVDSGGARVNLCDGTYGIEVTNGAKIATLGVSGYAGRFTDGTQTADLANGTYAIDVTAGSIRTLGTSGNTYRWENSTSAPSTQTLLTLPLNVYGAGTITDLLGDPDAWVLVNVGGTNYRLPCYL